MPSAAQAQLEVAILEHAGFLKQPQAVDGDQGFGVGGAEGAEAFDLLDGLERNFVGGGGGVDEKRRAMSSSRARTGVVLEGFAEGGNARRL
jgi:hypothetical protein